jgi:hypothetical protein
VIKEDLPTVIHTSEVLPTEYAAEEDTEHIEAETE